METLRLRLVFKDREILSESQKSEGLKRCWILLNPHIKTISDLSSHLLQSFQLHESCPHGVSLSMDGFVLPSFESTYVLKDKDILSVKRKTITLAIGGNGASNGTKELEIREPPENTRPLLLANEEFDKEAGGYESEESEEESKEEDGRERMEDALPSTSTPGCKRVSRKRKASEKLHGSKKKRLCSKESDGVQVDTSGGPLEILGQEEVSMTKKDLHVQDSKTKADIKCDEGTAGEINDHVETDPSSEKHDETQENGKEVRDVPDTSKATKKGPSRSARRKSAKRRWLREMAKIQKIDAVTKSEGIRNWKQSQLEAQNKEVDGQPKRHQKWKQSKTEARNGDMHDQPKGLLNWKKLQGRNEQIVVDSQPKGLIQWKKMGAKDSSRKAKENDLGNQNSHVSQQENQQSDAEDEVVPVQIRPGHFRFEPMGKVHAGQDVQPSTEPEATLQWNGITSKKKGQKWGTEKYSSGKGVYTDSNTENSSASRIEKDKESNEALDFEKLPFLLSGPEEGDLIAYRLLELSSCWTPELSPFRVGRVSWYNSFSGKIMLKPVAEYPIFNRKSEECESAEEPDNSPYRTDGSLEIDFSSLIDARIVRSVKLNPAKAIPTEPSVAPISNELAKLSRSNGVETQNRSAENGELIQANQTAAAESGVNIWEQLSETLNSKKAQLSGESSWGKPHSGKSSWSYRALRGSALGPTMAFLRSKSQI